MTVEQKMINDWIKEFIPSGKPSGSCTFESYIELAISDGFRMGYCRCEYSRSRNYVEGHIWLDDDHAKCPTFFRDAVLWHEFCHYWDCVEYFHVDHCTAFQSKKWKKPLYALGDVILKLIGWIWFD